MYACRLCRVALSAEMGCASCNPIRRNLVVVGETEDERPSLSGVSAEAVSTLRAQVKHLGGSLKTDPDDDAAHRRFIATSNALAKILGEARKLQDDGADAVANMSFHERAAMFVAWYADLPPAYRLSIREQQADFETKVAAPVRDEVALS
jgi:hypothetical protein